MIYTELILGVYAYGSRQIRYVSGDRDLCPRFGRGRDVETKLSKRYSRSALPCLVGDSVVVNARACAKVKVEWRDRKRRASTLNGAHRTIL